MSTLPRTARRKRRQRDCDFDRLPPRSSLPAEQSTDLAVKFDLVTEIMYCHDCQKKFSARVDYRINGHHILICPYCGHQHCRVVENGRVTGDRWDARNDGPADRVEVQGCRWTADSHPMQTSTVFEHVREAWLRRLG
jgi:DNA-directed RNA polymerase subunit RPC12/RpoP